MRPNSDSYAYAAYLHRDSPKGRVRSLLASLGFVVASLLSVHAHAEFVSLPSYHIGADQTSISGLSSGAFMAGQLHVAFSATFKKGLGVIAGGPYYCAESNVFYALGDCMDAQLYGIARASYFIDKTDQFASQGHIDPTSNMAGSRVYLFTGGRTDSGRHDTTVDWRVTDVAKDYWVHYAGGENVYYKNDIRAEHSMPTESYGSSCGTNGSPYINNCVYDAAGELLDWIYGTLNPRNNDLLTGTFHEFDQSEFIDDPESHGMALTGWVYVPANCAGGQSCKLHVALHGCKQSVSRIGDRFYKNAGYNRWADTNNIIVLYPQAAYDSNGNPNGCWDWWGYDDASYYRKTGSQMQAIKKMVDRLQRITSPAPGINYFSIAADEGYTKAYSDGTYPAVGLLSDRAIGRGIDTKDNRTVLSFDTREIPDHATITKAYLTVTCSSVFGDPWAYPVGNILVIDVKDGIFGSANTQETDDWASVPTAQAVATIARFTSGIKQSSDFNASGLAAINKTGKTQLKLRFSNFQTSTNYLLIKGGVKARLHLEYQ